MVEENKKKSLRRQKSAIFNAVGTKVTITVFIFYNNFISADPDNHFSERP